MAGSWHLFAHILLRIYEREREIDSAPTEKITRSVSVYAPESNTLVTELKREKRKNLLSLSPKGKKKEEKTYSLLRVTTWKQ